MMEERKVPALRFQGFTDEWEAQLFGSFAARESKAQISSKAYPCVEYEDIIAGEGVLNKDVRSKGISKKGIKFDNTMVLYGKLRPYLHNMLVPEFSGVAVGDWWVLRPGNVNRRFLYTLLQTKEFDDKANQSSGSKMPRADWNLISRSAFYIPNLSEEQSKIGAAFANLDWLIFSCKEQLAKLQAFKKSMLEKMFPRPCEKVPEVRFRGFTGDWEEKKLGELVSITSGYMGDSLLSDGKYRLTRIETISDGIVDETHIGYTNVKPDSFYLLRKGDILYSNINSLAHIGKIAMYEGDSILYHGINLLRLRPTVPLDSHFLMALLNTSQCRRWARSRANQAVNQASINQVLLASQSIKICSLIEQKQIGLFFRRLDIIITMQQRKLKKLYSLKQAMLSEMFI